MAIVRQDRVGGIIFISLKSAVFLQDTFSCAFTAAKVSVLQSCTAAYSDGMFCIRIEQSRFADYYVFKL